MGLGCNNRPSEMRLGDGHSPTDKRLWWHSGSPNVTEKATRTTDPPEFGRAQADRGAAWAEGSPKTGDPARQSQELLAQPSWSNSSRPAGRS